MSFLQNNGVELAKLVKNLDLKTVDLDRNSPTIKNEMRLIDYVLFSLSKRMGSVFLVSEDKAFANSYTNSLALLMNKPEKLQTFILGRHFDEDIKTRIVERLVGKTIISITINEIASKSQNDLETLSAILKEIMEEVEERGYILHIPDMEKAFEIVKSENQIPSIGLGFFFGSRPKARLPFLAPISWQHYSQHVEQGPMPLIVRSSNPILLSPRPKDILPFNIEHFSPDRIFSFE